MKKGTLLVTCKVSIYTKIYLWFAKCSIFRVTADMVEDAYMKLKPTLMGLSDTERLGWINRGEKSMILSYVMYKHLPVKTNRYNVITKRK